MAHININIWKEVDDLKAGKAKKKTPITPELWSQIEEDIRFTTTEKGLMRLMYWTGFSIKEAMDTKADTWVTIEGIPCIKLDQGKTDNRLKPLPVHSRLMPLWGNVMYTEGKSVQNVTRTINNKLEHYACTSHSFRNGWADRIRKLEVPSDMSERLQRHTDTRTLDKHYGDGYSVEQLKRVIDRLE